VDPVKPLEEQGTFEWEYDVEGDVLYLSEGTPRPALGVDVGDGLIFRYDESAGKLVGVTIVGVRSRLTQQSEPS
jgi:uncharacterized protein YuzE